MKRNRPPHRLNRDFRLPVLLCRLGEHYRLWWLGLAVSLVLARIALLPIVPIPAPEVQDEFSYLLAADTFSHGRLTNPALPMPEFFDSMHVETTPAYMSRYQPGQGFLLAIGQTLFGDPYWSIVLSVALMIYLFCWAADPWLPRHWTLATGILGWILFFVHPYWMMSYWSGALTACGGALVVGGLGRILKKEWKGARFALGAGAVIFYFTRPYEGGMICLAVLLLLGIHMIRGTADERSFVLRKVVLPNALTVLAAVPVAMAYNYGTTGSTTELAYFEYAKKHDASPQLWLMPPRPPVKYDTVTSQGTGDWERRTYEALRTLPLYKAVAMQSVYIALGIVGIQFLGFGLLLVGIPWARTRHAKSWLVTLLAAGFLAISLEVFVQAHYSAPFVAVEIILIVAAARSLWYRAGAMRHGPVLVMLALIVLGAPLMISYAGALQFKETGRATLIKQLTAMKGKHLVFTKYDKDWNYLDEWVYNGADLNASPVVFAHRRSDAENRQLLDYFPGRSVWSLELGPEEEDIHLERYDPERVEQGSLSPDGSVAAEVLTR